MSDNPFQRMFGPPSPEDREAHRKAMHEKQQETERMCKTAIPLLAEIQSLHHQLIEIGCDTTELTKSRKQIAILKEVMEAMLHVPPHRCR